ncbi:MAG: LPS export ABC transporter ATP-binding protein [Planctomycetales bacterium]|nr:LPS export ABC transporter ATP-binding protein [Planctomycetales bacterium]
MAILEVRGLEKTYGRRKVVSGVSLTVGDAEIVGLLGPNGAGKSTSFKMTCGIVRPDRGQVYLSGTEVTDWPLYRRAAEGGMGYLAQESSVFRKLSVEQNILALYELLGVPSRERKVRTERLLSDFEITHIRKSKASRLSGGERRRLEIARCLVSEPRIIMLDEPFAGIDPITVQNIQEIIKRLRDRGIAILITDHAAREILQTVDRCYVISKGSVLCEGSPDEIKQHAAVREEYLGDIVDEPLRDTSRLEVAIKPEPTDFRIVRQDASDLRKPSKIHTPPTVEPSSDPVSEHRPSRLPTPHLGLFTRRKATEEARPAVRPTRRTDL